MHVIYFHQHFSTPRGAVGIRSYQMAQGLLRKGHQVTMVCGKYAGGITGLEGAFKNGKREGMVDGIKVVEFDLAYANSDGFIRRTLTFLKFSLRSIILALREPYDLAFATTTPLTAGIPGIVARWIRRKPFVFEVRDLWPELPREMGVITNPLILWMMGVLEWTSYRSAHRCVALSPGIAKGIERCGVRPEKIAMVPNGCDLDIFKETTEKPWRPAGVSRDDLMAVFAGTHGLANGLDNVLEGAKELKKRSRKDIKIVLIGRGKLTDSLKEQAQRDGLDNVIFHEPVSKAKLSGLMADTDIGIQSLANVPAFYYGTSPNKFFDYIAAGLPVLNNYPGWIADLVSENECGFAVPPLDEKAFADALEEAADNRTALKRMGENASLLAAKQFNRSDLVEQWCDWIVEDSA
ncbi:MAG: glycosyltransferase family 4 protein [Hyphomicrobiales bacterium]